MLIGLKLWRETKRWSQNDVSRRVEVTPGTVGRWERGEVWPQPENFEALEKLTGLKRTELIDGVY